MCGSIWRVGEALAQHSELSRKEGGWKETLHRLGFEKGNINISLFRFFFSLFHFFFVFVLFCFFNSFASS